MTADKKRILIVDDHAGNRESLRAILEDRGYHVLVATDGSEALASARQAPPNLVISDLLMPVMDGYTLLRHWKADDQLCRIPFIVYTGTYTGEKDQQLALDLGADAFILKPGRLADLMARINALLLEVGAGTRVPHAPPVEDKEVLFREYSETLVHKLEEKLIELEEKNRALEKVISERTIAEQRLAESERRFREIFESANVGIALADPDDRFLAANTWFSEILGYSREELLQLHTFDLVHPDDLEESRRMTMAVHKGNIRAQRAERRYLRKDGTVIWVSVFAATVFDDAGKEKYSIGVVSDNTERRRAEQALRASEERFSKAFKSSPMAISMSSLAEGRFSEVNDAFLKMFGFQRDEVVGRTSIELKLWRDQADRARLALGLLTNGGIRDLEYAYTRKSGEIGWALCSADVVEIGGEACVLTLFNDITERKRAEGELRESERRFRSLLSNMDLVSMMLDTQARITYCNDFLLHLTGWQREELLGRDYFETLIAPEDDDVKEAFSALIHDLPSAWHYENHIQTRTGERRLIRWNNTVLRSTSGEVIGTASIGADITDQRQAEIGIRRLNRIYAVLSGINALVVRERDRQHLFDEACRIAVDDGQFGLVWIGTVDNETQRISPVALRGPEADCALISTVDFTAHRGAGEGKGTVGEAVQSLMPEYRNDLTADLDAHPKLMEFCDRGYRSAISLPLVVHGTCAAVMVLYAKEAGFFDRDELKLLSELAGDLSFALEYMEQEQKVNFLAVHDALTGLANRAQLLARLTQALETARGRSQSCALMLMNINNFHHVNNTLGQNNGDQLLREIALRVRQSVWDSDMVACLGGDEFAILLPRLASSEDIDLVVRKVAAALRGTFTVAGLPISLEARMGYAIFPDQADNADLLWQRAGVAVRAAKELHMPQIMYDRSIDHYDPRRLALVSGFQSAIDADELVLHYQPKIDMQRQCVTGVEALLRWQHPEQGLLSPDSFIPLVESTALIHPMTIWVLANAMRQARVWDRAGMQLDFAVNLSVRNLQNPNLMSEIMDLARSSCFPLDRLTLEITESAIMVDPEHGKSVLIKLHEAGIRFSMDDFGIGHSSLGYLKDLPITQLKIDKSFVIGFSEPRNAAIVHAALEMGHNLGMHVTAEGIEDEATFLALRDLGCDTGQGFFFSKPLPPDKFSTWLRTSTWKLPRLETIGRMDV